MTATRFFKMTGSGNDFVVLDGRDSAASSWTPARIEGVCDRRNGVGADGLVVLTPEADGIRMHYWNADGSPRPGTPRLLARLERVLSANPKHPGACHLYIHAVEARDPARALECAERLAALMPGAGHIVHMPGHIYSGIGMWHEGAIWMDSATRVEKRYMERRLALPYDDWNYGHNRNYLSFIQEQLGMPTLALDGARQLLRAPLDPEANAVDGFGLRSEGLTALVRGLVDLHGGRVRAESAGAGQGATFTIDLPRRSST